MALGIGWETQGMFWVGGELTEAPGSDVRYLINSHGGFGR